MRIQQVLIDNWYIRQLDTDKPDIAILTQEVLSPDKNWLKAQMPAQIHDILFEHGLIRDPHEGVIGALFEDNYFDMLPSRTIAIIDSAGGKRVNINALNADGISVDL